MTTATTITIDVRIATSLRGHRKTKRLRKKLGPGACWSLVCLFMYAAEHRWDGTLTDLSDEDIEDEADWDGEPGALVAALLAKDIKFLVGPAGARRIHDWQDWNPYAAARGERSVAARAAANARWKKPNANQGELMLTACDPHAVGTEGQCPLPDLALQVEKQPSIPVPPAAAVGDGPMDREGIVEGHGDIPAETPNPAARLAMLLTRAGFACTPLNPTLLAYTAEGGTFEHLDALAKHPDCQGKKVGYLLAIARRELVASPAARPEASGRPAAVAGPATNPGGISPVIVGEEAAARQRDALAAMERQMKELGVAP